MERPRRSHLLTLRSLVAAVGALLVSVSACSWVEDRPAVFDEEGLVVDWDYIESLAPSPASPDDGGTAVRQVDAATVRLEFWSLGCKNAAKLEVSQASDAIELHLSRGREPAGGCDAVSILRGFVVTFEQPVDAIELKVVDQGD
jgi:hypothetical protein